MIRQFLRQAVLATVLMTASCATVSEQASYDSISLTRTACFGFCPAYTVTMYNDGKVVWEGHMNVEKKGLDSAYLDEQVFIELQQAFEDADFLSFNDDYRDMNMTDCPSAILEITDGKLGKSVNRYTCDRNAPEVLEDLENLVDSLSGAKAWIGNPEFE